MSLKRFKTTYSKNVSSLHVKVGDALKTGIFQGFKVYQEYPVSRVNPTYYDNSHKFDWVVLDLKLVIECHGQQHFKPISFGNTSAEETLLAYSNQKFRDKSKEIAALEAGFTYVMIPYTDINKISDTYIYSLYTKNYNSSKPLFKQEDPIKKSNQEYRKEMYRRLKELRKQQE